MPTKRTRATRNLIPQISDEELHFLSDGLLGTESDEEKDPWFWLISGDRRKLKELWDASKLPILEGWIRERPGSRPSLWWRFDAPRMSQAELERIGAAGCYYACDLPDPRRRLGGIGNPNFEHLGFAPSYSFGIPSGWVEQWQLDYYNGRARDVHGNPIGTQYHEGNFTGRPVDPRNPPRFESQAAYLKRHGLLEPGEERRLKPKDFEPERVLLEEEEESQAAVIGRVQ